MTAPRKRNGWDVEAAQRMCAAKLRYPDLMTAKAAGMHYVETGQVDALWTYRCPICRGVHLTRTNHGPRRNVFFGA